MLYKTSHLGGWCVLGTWNHFPKTPRDKHIWKAKDRRGSSVTLLDTWQGVCRSQAQGK